MTQPHTPPSREAVQLHREALVIDLHVDCLFTQRLFGYDPARRHRPWIPRSAFVNHADIPLRRGFAEEQIRGILGENFLRVFGRVQPGGAPSRSGGAC